VLQAAGEQGDSIGNGARALGTADAGRVEQLFEVQIVAIAAAVDAEHQYDRALEHQGELERRSRKRRLGAEERHAHEIFLVERPIAENADPGAVLQPLVDLEHGVEAAQCNDVARQHWIDRLRHRGDLPGVILVHQHGNSDVVDRAHGAQNLEAAHVCTQQQTALATLEHLLQHLFAVQAGFEQLVALLE